jgi:hypothetical protein
MTTMISSLFPSRRHGSGSSGKRRQRRGERLSVQPLEERIALAIDVFQLPMNAVDSSANNYAVLVLDQGDGGFLKRNAGGSFTFANNSQFLNGGTQTALGVPALYPDWGALTTFYVTSGQRMIYGNAPLVEPSPGTSVFFSNASGDIDIGTNDGIVPGTFSAILTVTDTSGNTESGLVYASSPGAAWNLNFSGDLGSLRPSRGRISEFSGAISLEWSTAPASVTLIPIEWAVYTGSPNDVAPLSFTVSPGQDVTQSMIFDLTRTPSTVTLNSPVLAVAGPGSTAPFFIPAGSVSIAAETIAINANTSSVSSFSVSSPDVAINRPVAAPVHGLNIIGTPASPGRLVVSEQGAVTGSIANPSTGSAGILSIDAVHADVIIAGVVNATQQTYLLQSPLDPRSYSLTTLSPTSGVQTGRIFGDTVGITLANDAGGEVNVQTTIDTLRMTASSTLTEPALPYAIAVTESDDLVVDAVPASRRPIVLDVAGTLTLSSSVQTTGSLRLAARNQLKLSGAVSSAAGDVVLVSDSIISTIPITAGGTRSVSLQSRDADGDVVLNGLVRAGGVAKSPARAASTADIVLATGGLLLVDGVSLVAGDRVLVKNQTNPAENGIYVAESGAWFRAPDANTSQLFLPGFTVAVHEGNQQGAWTFANAASPTLGQTGLAFVPASAVQAYVPARATTTATTGNVNLAAGSLLTIDGVTLLPGDRVLVMNQTNPRQNGLYIADVGAWVRAADANTAAELIAGSYVFVTEGSAGQQGYVLTDDAVQVGNTPLTFVPYTVQATRTNNYSPARVLTTVVAATTVHVDLAAPPAEIDGITLVAGDLVLVKNQFDAATNGVYVSGPGGLQRWSGADTSSEMPRGSMVFVEEGATNANSSWTFNDSIDVLGQTTAGSLQVTGLPSTLYLASGMLVTGFGIPSGTKIDLVVNSTTVRLTKSALVSSSVAVLGFMQTSAVAIGTTPILFVPTGGTAAVTAGQNISSSTASPSSRITASSAVLTAGRPVSGTAAPASLIDVNSAVGRLTAMAPGSVGVSDSAAIDLFYVQTLVAGGVAVDAQGTISARSVLAAGSAATPANVTLESAYGDVVAATVTSSLGSIDLTSANERVVVRRLGLNGASVTAVDGDVVATANVGGILLEGPVTAGGTDGDITLRSDQKGLTLVPPATLSATGRLTVTTPNAVPSVATGVTVSAAALSLTSQFGASQSLPTGFGTFSTINLNRTDAGSLVLASLVGLTVEAATAVAGNVSLTAPSMQVTGGVTAGSSVAGDGAIKLTATAGNIDLAAPVTALADRVTLDAAAGVITQSSGQINSQTLVWYATTSPLPGLAGTFNRVGSNLTGPGSLSLGTAGTPIVIVGASTVSGSITITGSNVRIVDVVKANAGDPVSITATAGNIEFVANTLGGVVSLPGAATSGSVTLTASSGQVMAANKATRTTVRGGPLTVVAQTADLKCNVTSLTSTTTLGGLTASAVGGFTLAGITAAGQNVALNAASGVTQATGGITANALTVTNGSGTVNLTSTSNAVSNVAIGNGSGNVSLTNSGNFTVAAPGIATGTGSAGDGNISLTSIGGSIGLNAGVTAGGDLVTLNATSGSITQAAGATVASDTLIWYASAVPSLTGSYVGIGSNLTAPGSLSLAVTPALRVLATSTVNGGITITGPSVVISEPVTAGGTGSGITVQATTGNIALQPSSSLVPSINAPSGAISVVAGGQFDTQFGTVSGSSVSIVSGGTVFVGTIRATNTMSVVTTAGGVSVGPQAGALLQAGSTLDLSQVQGQIRIRNGGQIIGNPLVLGGKSVSFGGAITTVAELNDVVNAVNSLPVVAGSTYEILVGASMTLTQTLTINRPVTFRGTSTSIVLSGSASVTNGLSLTSGAAGSTVRDIAFSNFSGTAVRATSLSGLTISGINVMNSGTGINLTSVTNSLIGGAATGQGNVLQNCSREGIYATGICTNTQLVKNTFPSTTTKYNVSSSRGITVVN